MSKRKYDLVRSPRVFGAVVALVWKAIDKALRRPMRNTRTRMQSARMHTSRNKGAHCTHRGSTVLGDFQTQGRAEKTPALRGHAKVTRGAK